MAKPICVVYYLPDALGGKAGVIPSIVEVNKLFENKFPDYHVFAFPSYQAAEGNARDIELEVFNADNMAETSLEEFKKEILETLLVT